jgi:ferrous iron transport protein A
VDGMSLYDLNLGEKAIIKYINGDDKLTKRLLALGCIEGTEIELKRIAPLGDPIIVNLRGFDLAIRKKDAKNIFLAV